MRGLDFRPAMLTSSDPPLEIDEQAKFDERSHCCNGFSWGYNGDEEEHFKVEKRMPDLPVSNMPPIHSHAGILQDAFSDQHNRIRRVKCDETTPSCLRCTKTGRKCDGYQFTTSKTKPPTTIEVSQLRQTGGPLSPTSYCIPFRVPGSQRDRQLLHYFCVEGSSQISGFIKHEFWARTVLLASQDDHIVRQSLVALSALHADLSQGGSLMAAREDTLIRYGKALRSLQRRIGAKEGSRRHSSTELSRTTLICCVLFHCFELSLGNGPAAMSHLKNGLQLLDADHDQTAQDDDFFTSLKDTLSRLDLQATFFDDGRTPSLHLVPAAGSIDGDSGPVSPQSFSSLENAQRSLVELQNWQFRFLLVNTTHHDRDEFEMPMQVLEEKTRLLDHCEKWRQRLDAYGETMMDSSSSGLDKASVLDRDIALRTLRMQYEATLMLVSSKAPARPEVFGAVPNLAARKVIQLCESIMGNASASTATEHHLPSPVFSLETGPVSVLFLLALKCSDQQVVRKAAELLERHQRRESLYDSHTVAVMIQRLESMKAQRKSEMTENEVYNCSNDSLEYWCGHLMESEQNVMGDPGLEAIPSGCSTVDSFTSTYTQLLCLVDI